MWRHIPVALNIGFERIRFLEVVVVGLQLLRLAREASDFLESEQHRCLRGVYGAANFDVSRRVLLEVSEHTADGFNDFRRVVPRVDHRFDAENRNVSHRLLVRGNELNRLVLEHKLSIQPSGFTSGQHRRQNIEFRIAGREKRWREE